MAAVGGSKIGLRKNNEDRYYISDDGHFLAVADGMGGHEHGQLASRIAVERFAAYAAAGADSFSLEQMRMLFYDANRAVYQRQETFHSGIMGTTLTAAVICGDLLYVGHVGDSRLYLLHGGEAEQLTEDHSYYAELMRQGSEELHVGNRQKNVLLRALGPEEAVEGQFLERVLAPGDQLLLCTDGFYNVLQAGELPALLAREPLEDTVERLLTLALERGASDNLTVILYRHEPAEKGGR